MHSSPPTDANIDFRAFRRDLRSIERGIARGLRKEPGYPGCCGLSLAQCHALLAVPPEGRSLVELGRELGVEPSTLTRSLDGLERLGFVQRRAAEGDRRSGLAARSEAGTAKVSEIDQAWGSWFAAILSRLPAAKRPTVVEGIALLAEAMRAELDGRPEEEPCC